MKIVCVSGSRADTAAIYPIVNGLDTRLLNVDGLACRDGFDAAFSCARAMMDAAEAYKKLKPDLVFIPGDRFEVLGAAIAAYLMNIPIAHLGGGDITEGSQDDSMRHAITKLAHLHFPTNDEAALRILEMGEDSWRVHMVGSTHIDYLKSFQLHPKHVTTALLGMPPGMPGYEYILVNYQPPTLGDWKVELDSIFSVLDKFAVFATVNTDAGGIEVTKEIVKFCNTGRGRIVAMSHQLYLSAMKHCDYLIGNSSSAFYEAPTLGTQYVNIGVRQKGRQPVTGDGKATERIKNVITALGGHPELLHKKWRGPWQVPLIPNGIKSTKPEVGEVTPKRSWSDLYSEVPGSLITRWSSTSDLVKEPQRGSLNVKGLEP